MTDPTPVAKTVSATRKRLRVLATVLLAATLPAAPALAQKTVPTADRPGAEREIRLATTTSTENSGLLADLLPAFEKAHGYRVRVVAVGTGAALKIGANGDADLVLVHARAAEDRFVAAGFGIDRRDVMYNDFVLVGPKADPAAVRTADPAAVRTADPAAVRTADPAAARTAGPAAAALRAIAARGQRFVSRGDDSGTHQMELALWKSAGGLPKWPGYLAAGRGMGEVLSMASELQAYALADRGTWASMRAKLDLAVVSEGDSALANPYGIIRVNPARHPHVNAAGARALVDWMTSPEGQRRIAAFKVGGETLFFPAAARSQ